MTSTVDVYYKNVQQCFAIELSYLIKNCHWWALYVTKKNDTQANAMSILGILNQMDCSDILSFLFILSLTSFIYIVFGLLWDRPIQNYFFRSSPIRCQQQLWTCEIDKYISRCRSDFILKKEKFSFSRFCWVNSPLFSNFINIRI